MAENPQEMFSRELIGFIERGVIEYDLDYGQICSTLDMVKHQYMDDWIDVSKEAEDTDEEEDDNSDFGGIDDIP